MFRKEYGKFVSYTRKYTSENDVEDIVQDVILNIFEKADITAPVRNLTSYIYQSLRNRITDIARKKKRTVSLSLQMNEDGMTLEDVLEDPGPGLGEIMENRELREAVFSAIDSLSMEQQAVIIETEFKGRTFRELSEEWGVPAGTLLARKSRAVGRLRKILSGGGTE